MDPDAVTGVQRRVQQAWSTQRWEDWADTCARDYLFDTGIGYRMNQEETLRWSRAWFYAFPDYTEEVGHVHATRSSVVYELVGRATATGAFVLDGKVLLPATGNPFELSYAKVLEVDEWGMVTRDRQYLNQASLLLQLGLG
ncbi:ester cyclase [Nocardia sp. NBC_01377]|uniref:ester cyclase n=1 Tax=Nocardia TaxID=1817 RepID=UPI001C223968|nr:ester cyclase [Nocardia noduli]